MEKRQKAGSAPSSARYWSVSVAIFIVCLLAGVSHAERLRPFYPSLIDTNTGAPVELSSFTSAERCGVCHSAQYEGWSQSMHAFAFKDPFYRAVLAEASRETGGKVDRLCVGCHTPIGTVAEFVWIKENGEIEVDEMANEGVTCDLCHSIVEVFPLELEGELGNAGFLVDPQGPKRGPHKDAISDFHATEVSPLHSRSEICGACHNIFHPVENVKIARTYDEWANSIYAENGIQCQDCHMVPPVLVPEVARTLRKPHLPGSTSNFNTFRTPFYPHTFSGANVPIPQLMGAEGHAAQAERLLQLAATVSINLVKFNSTKNTLGIDITIKNERAGHNLPTSMTEIRQMWMELTVKDMSADSELVWVSGALDEEGNLDPDAKRFGARAVDKDGNPTWKPWKIHAIDFDNSIPAKRTARLSYTAKLEDSSGPYRVSARLLYRSFPQHLADKYLKLPDYTVPVITMASDMLMVDSR